MALAGNQHQIAFTGRRQRRLNGRGAIVDDGELIMRTDNGGGDGVGVFRARIVGGDDDLIGARGGGLAHQGPLAGVTVAATAEHQNQPAVAMVARRG